MTVLSRYILRRAALPFGITLAVMLLALTLERLLEITRTVTDRGAPVGQALEMIAALLPHYLGLSVPAAAFLAVLVALHQLRQASELSVLYAAGIPLTRLLRPLVGAALVLAGLMAVNTAFLQPYGRHAYRSTLHEIADIGPAMRIQPGVFYELGDGTALRAGSVSPDGRTLERVFAARDRADGGRTFIVAEAGTLGIDPETSRLVVRMSQGTLIQDRANGGAERVGFQSYVLTLPDARRAVHGPRGQDERELTIPELLTGKPTRDAAVTPAQRAAELNKRLVTAVSIPLLAVLAVPLALLATGRVGRLTRFAAAILALVLYQKLLAVAEGLVATGALAPWAGQWGVVAGFALATVVLLRATQAGGVGSSRARGAPAAMVA